MNERARRNIELFGSEGQRRIEETRVAIVGYGGLGSHVGQQLAYLGTLRFTVIEPDTVEYSNLNRLVGAVPADAHGRVPKLDVADRTIKAINPSATVTCADVSVTRAGGSLSEVDVVFGAIDNDAARLALTELCSEQGLPYIDMATDTGELENGKLWFGGRVLIASGHGCLSCLGLFDQRELARAAMTPDQREADDRIYGVDRAMLDASGPMVVSVNGIVASIAVTEYIALVTRVRTPFPYPVYRGEQGIVNKNRDAPNPSCFYCQKWNARTAP